MVETGAALALTSGTVIEPRSLPHLVGEDDDAFRLVDGAEREREEISHGIRTLSALSVVLS